MGDSGLAQGLPAALGYPPAVADGEGSDQPIAVMVRERRANPPCETGTHSVDPGERQRGCGTNPPGRPDVARGDNPVREQPSLVVGASGVAPSLRPAQPDGHAPDRTRGRYGTGAEPGQPHPAGRNPGERIGVDVEVEPRPERVDLGQSPHGAGDLDVPAVDVGRQRRAHLQMGGACRPGISRERGRQWTRTDPHEREPRGNGQPRAPHRVRQRRLALEQSRPDHECGCEHQHGCTSKNRRDIGEFKRFGPAAEHGRARRVVDNALPADAKYRRSAFLH